MKPAIENIFRSICVAAAFVLIAVSTGCAGAGEGAVRGASGGALAGAASGLVSALVWGGDPGEYMARGATAGATIGAIGGAVEGSSKARAQEQNAELQQQREIEQFRRDIGNDSFDAIVALAECKYEVAVANAKVASKSGNSNHALAGLWTEALTYADMGDNGAIDSLMPEILRWDRNMDNAAEVRKELENTHTELLNIRSEYQLPRFCNS